MDEVIQEIIDDLKKIPERVETKIIIDEIAEALVDKLRRKIAI